MDVSQTLFEENLEFVEDLYAQFLRDPASVDPAWREVFAKTNGGRPRGPDVTPRSIFSPREIAPATAIGASTSDVGAALRAGKVQLLVDSYRTLGHLAAQLDPLGTPHDPRPHPELELSTYGFSLADLDAPVAPQDDLRHLLPATVHELYLKLRLTYARTIGVELSAIDEPAERDWLLARMEPTLNRRALSRGQQLRILERLVAAEQFERFLHAKYVGTKRFSLEGAETIIPLLDLLVEGAAELGVEQCVIGMAHRGRLNVLVNVLGRDPAELLAEFEDVDPEATLGSGDVKYHLGYSNEHLTTSGKKVALTLTFNPSHLEAVDPVVLGRARARQDRLEDVERSRVMPVLLHGDAAFAGQGLVSEILNLAALKGYRTGGTIHVIVNNQIGFTTSPRDSRSTIYATDVALAAHCPILHVNGEDPEAVAQVVALALEYRHTFQKDVVIDVYCYRKYGHNESDEPSFTQPLLYRRIDAHPSPVEVYSRKMQDEGAVGPDDVARIVNERVNVLEAALERARATSRRPEMQPMGGVWASYRGGRDAEVPDVETGVAKEALEELLERLVTIPETFHPHPKIVKLLDARREAGAGKRPLDWGLGEALAFATLLVEGTRVRISGQDSRRGTFSHRHAVLTDIDDGAEYAPLANLRPGQAEFNVYDSALSELGVMGFDYGYSLESPDALVAWEAQFGDFANGAQVLIDQFLASAEDKWRRFSGLVLLLPHGYEGQGPEHSSARPERWLQLCAEDNLQVCQPTTPGQLFHLLRRQVRRPIRKPLIVLTPKSLLRHPKAVSTLEELGPGHAFERVLLDRSVAAASVTRVLLCTGKVAFELEARREKQKDASTAIVRVEQLYPFPDRILAGALAHYPGARDVAWIQDEPLNMGAWTFVAPRLQPLLPAGASLRHVGRAESASPATGSPRAHAIEQEQILRAAFTSGSPTS